MLKETEHDANLLQLLFETPTKPGPYAKRVRTVLYYHV